ncbi:MAG: ATP-binding protein [Clostridiales bacterium]|nr:ATP-binding protein [Clostridiales bacterium]
MERYFNITGCCNPQEHYMVNLDSRLAQIKKMIDRGQYFCINRGRQYGKTTILGALEKYLENDYIVVSMDFQGLSTENFKTEMTFVKAFTSAFLETLEFSDYQNAFKSAKENLIAITDMTDLFRKLFYVFKSIEKKFVLIIDEVDQASNNQVFFDFLALLRMNYLKRHKRITFQSVILAGVHDIRNLRQKIRPDAEHRHNSPWNIASSFNVDMSFSPQDIAGMLEQYENDYHTGMDIKKISQLIYDYTSGYPVLVTEFCKIMDESVGWSEQGVIEANKQILIKKTPLFESLIGKLEDNEFLRKLLYGILFKGQKIPYNPDDATIDDAFMYGFVKNEHGLIEVANRVFEVRIYNWFISIETTDSLIFAEGVNDKNQFISGNQLNIELILEKFILHFNDIYGSQPDKFKEDDGRKLFLLYLRPIINGTGNYYIEAQTRDQRRTDVIVDYLGKQYIIELKIWHGDEYNTKGEQQLSEYLDYYHINKGYLLSFNFNKNKQSGMHTIELNGRTIIEAIV